jgi:hypothetical protein
VGPPRHTPGGEPPEDFFRRLVEAWHVVDRDDGAGARRCGGCAAYASIARPQCPSTAGSCSPCRASRRCAYWYNQAHLHSALGHVPPLEFERAHGRQVTPAQQPVARRTGPLLNPRAVQDAAITQPEFSFASRTINAR